MEFYGILTYLDFMATTNLLRVRTSFNATSLPKIVLTECNDVNCACLSTLQEHQGRVFRLQFDDFQIVSSSHDDTILMWDFLNYTPEPMKDAKKPI